MTIQFTVSPDFGPDAIAAWYFFNTWLQRATGEQVHLELYRDFAAQRTAVARGAVDLIFANPYDAAALVRDHGYVPLARPTATPSSAAASRRSLNDRQPYPVSLKSGRRRCRVCLTMDPQSFARSPRSA